MVEKIKDFEIIYDEAKKEKVEEIKNIILNNYTLFKMYLGNIKKINLTFDTKDSIYIEDFDTFFYDILDKRFNIKNPIIEENISLPNAYVAFLIRKVLGEKSKFGYVNSDSSDEMFDFLFEYMVPYEYYKETSNLDDFVAFCKDKKESLKIYTWLKNKTRFDAYNMLLEELVNRIKECDFLYNNLDEICDILYYMIIENKKIDKDSMELSTITKEKRDILFIKFLDFINAPTSWYQKYFELKEHNYIIYEDDEKEISSKCFKDEDGITKIKIIDSGTIRSFISLVHEFMHYISWQEDVDLSKIMIQEIPSLFFEKVAALFLIKCGYNKEMIYNMMQFRSSHDLLLCIDLFPIYKSISDFIKNGSISEEKEVNLINKLLNDYNKENNSNISLQELYKMVGFDIGNVTTLEFVRAKYDNLIKEILCEGTEMLDGFQYIIGSKLTNELMEKLDNSVIEKMIEVTNNLDKLSIEDILLMFKSDNNIKKNKLVLHM